MTSNLQGSALESYLVREVQTICDADPDLVAQYISALITSGDPPHVLRQSLDDKLREFFGDQTVPFIDRLFKELGYDSKEKSHDNVPERSRRLSDYSDEEDDGDRNFKHRRPRTEARDDSRYSRSSDDRHYKRHMSDGYSKRNDYDRGGRGIPTGPAAMYQQSFDNRSRGGRGGYRGDMARRPLCRDYNEKGYCMRGDMCPYDHGADRIVVDDGSFNTPAPFPNVSAQMGPPMNQQQAPFFGMPNNFDAYDPERATLMPNGGNMASFPADMPGMMIPSDGMGNNRMFATPRGRGRGGRGGRGRGGMSGGSHQKRQYTTLVVENIPPEFCEISKVNEYFKKFGAITNISVQGHLNKAILQFSTNAEASAAYNSPDPIFDNRFVKVYWHKENDDDNKDARAKPEQPTATAPAKRANEPDPEEVAARAAELAKQREEKQKKHQERMKAILDVQKQKEQLLQKQIEEQKRLMEKLTSSSNMSKAEKEDLLKSLKKINSDIDSSRSKPAPYAPPVPSATAPAPPASAEPSSTEEPSQEELHAKLAKLEAEAANLGITSQGYGGFRGGRGGYYGRGRGWPRMRGGMTRYTLDNRPTKFHVKGAPEDSKEEMRKHFEQFGKVTRVEPHEDGLIVEYSQRFEAEKAMAGGVNTPRGKFEFSWYTGAAPSNGSSQASTPTPASETPASAA